MLCRYSKFLHLCNTEHNSTKPQLEYGFTCCKGAEICCVCRATVKAGTQKHETERRMKVMWFHTGNYTKMMQEVMINGSFPAATRVV